MLLDCREIIMISVTYAQRSSSAFSVLMGLISGFESSVLLKSISV